MEKDLVVVENLNAVKIFQEDGMKVVLDGIESKALAIVADVETEGGRKEIASVAYKVARSKTLIDDMGKKMVSKWKADAKKVDAVRKEARDFLDGVKDQVRAPLTDWEAIEAKRKEEEAEAERVMIQNRVDTLQTFGVVVSLFDVASLTDAEFNTLMSEAEEKWAAEKVRLAKEEADRKAEAGRLEQQRKDQEAAQKLLGEASARHQAKVDAENKKIAADRKALEDEKKAEQDRKNLAKIIEDARVAADALAAATILRETAEATAKAEREVKEAAEAAARKEQEAKDKAEAEEKEKARQEQLRPDREKLIAYLDSILLIPKPRLGVATCEHLDWFAGELIELIDKIKTRF